MLNIFKTLFSVLGGTTGLILRFMLAIGLMFLFVYCVFTMMRVPFLWEGALRLVGILASGLGFIWLVGAFRKQDEDAEARDDRRE